MNKQAKTDSHKRQAINIAKSGMTNSSPQWITTSRLLKLGETIRFEFFLPGGGASHDLTIYPLYLETANPSKTFRPDGGMEWLSEFSPVKSSLNFVNGKAEIVHMPEKAGNYLAKWSAEGEEFYRYFSVVDNAGAWIVLSFSPFANLDPTPTFHGTGIPLSYRLPVEHEIACPGEKKINAPFSADEIFDAGSPVFKKLLDYHRLYGDTIIPMLQTTPELSHEERVKLYRKRLDKVRSLLPDHNDTRSVFIDDGLQELPAYTKALMELGVNDHCGFIESSVMPWLGIPEFPYFTSLTDPRKVNQNADGSVVGHQYDFCGGWHFLGPASWHYKASNGRWDIAQNCLEQGLSELRDLAELSKHPAFAFPLYDGIQGRCDGTKTAADFVAKYQYVMAFEFTKQYNLVFARTIDIADYYIRHHKTTPRTVFVSKTDHLAYDSDWLVHSDGFCHTRDKIPWQTNVSAITADRKLRRPDKHPQRRFYKDPFSCEYILYEDQKRSIRFERECPNAIWWFDYSEENRERIPGLPVNYTELPDVKIVKSSEKTQPGDVTIKLKMITDAEFPDYAVALWDLPVACSIYKANVITNAKDFVLCKNTAGRYHLVLFFDLVPDLEITVELVMSSVA